MRLSRETVRIGFRSIGCKLSLAIFLMVLLLTGGLAAPIMRIMDSFLLQELIKRGASVSQSAATPAAYSLLANDRLALDNLAAKIAASQPDIGYLAIVSPQGKILAHNRLDATGLPFESAAGEAIAVSAGTQVRKILREAREFYEFSTPILFSEKVVGNIYMGIDAVTLETSRQQARRAIATVAIITTILGVAAILLLSTLITAPVKRLAAGVARLKAGELPTTIHATSGDELGRLTCEFNEMAHTIAGQRSRLEEHARELEESYTSMVRILAASIEARDHYTLGHSTRVANLSVLVGRHLEWDPEVLKDLALSCFLHDLGKIRVPDAILKKPGPLDPEEMQALRRHPEHGADILRLSESLHRHIPTVLHHHEWYNGQGYPAGLRGDEIPLPAAIVSLADTYDALTSCRPYRAGRSREEAVREIHRFRGIQFAPALTDLFIEVLKDYSAESSPMGLEVAV
ncbi:MAG: HD domain-containing phosphohydrolase [Desulfuromonadales bacterium]